MDDKKTQSRGGNYAGIQVSKIANIFQSMAPPVPVHQKDMDTDSSSNYSISSRLSKISNDEYDDRKNMANILANKESPTQVTVVRTESHLARFNNARALFEKLGEENARLTSSITTRQVSNDRMFPLQGTKSASSIQSGVRSRSSSGNSELSKHHRRVRSRSPSPLNDENGPTPKLRSGNFSSSTPPNVHKSKHSKSVKSDDDAKQIKHLNGFETPPTHLMHPVHQEIKLPKKVEPPKARSTNVTTHSDVVHHDINDLKNIKNGVKFEACDQERHLEKHKTDSNAMKVEKKESSNLPHKPTIPNKKPEKPERKFNSRELIEKQKNWTSHFTKTRSSSSSRYSSDPNKSELLKVDGLQQNESEEMKTNSTSNLTASNHAKYNCSVDSAINYLEITKTKSGSCDLVDLHSQSAIPSKMAQYQATRSASFSVGPRDVKIRSPTSPPPEPPLRTDSKLRAADLTRRLQSSNERVNLERLPNVVQKQPAPTQTSLEDETVLKVESLAAKLPPRGIPVVQVPIPARPNQHVASSTTQHSLPEYAVVNKKANSNALLKEDCENREVVSPIALDDNAHGNKQEWTRRQRHLLKSPPATEKLLDDCGNKENLSATTDSLSSLSSSPSSPSKLKTEEEKQEDESNEKINDKSSSAECLKSQDDDECPSDIYKGANDSPNVPKPTNRSSVVSAVSSNDEGGFNEPTPDIKARLRHKADNTELLSDDDVPNDVQNTEIINSNNNFHYNSPPLPPLPLTPPDSESDSLIHIKRRVQMEAILENEHYVVDSRTYTKTKKDVNTAEPINCKTQPLYIETQHTKTNGHLPSNTDSTNKIDELEDNRDSLLIVNNVEDCLSITTPAQVEELINKQKNDTNMKLNEEIQQNASHNSTLINATRQMDSLLNKRNNCGFDMLSKSEGNLLDLEDVQFADADSDDEIMPITKIISKSADNLYGDDKAVNLASDNTSMMTPDEAENLLSSSILEKKLRKEGLLSDEEAQEVVRLLSPKDATNQQNLNDWTGVSHASSLMNDSVVTADSTTADSITSSHYTESELSRNGIDSFNENIVENCEVIEPVVDYQVPMPGRIVVIENGVHYYEDGHFWMEVPGLPECEQQDELDYPGYVKKTTKVTFSTRPMKVYSTFSVNDYDRRNEDVDPVAASAEYELEKRVEKMDVFPVELIKGIEGLGLSIIGMGVGADAGLEKLGIFVKTITDNGAAARDGKIKVNDQIIEVDGKSLVGVTQAYAASVLRNTSGLVKFLIGRERDPENSEVAQLIRQSLQADKEREERLNCKRGRQSITSAGSVVEVSQSEESSAAATVPLNSSTNTSISDGPVSPSSSALNDNVFEPNETPLVSDVDGLKNVLQETQYKLALTEAELNRIRVKLLDVENPNQSSTNDGDNTDRLRQSNAKVREVERNLVAVKKELSNYQNMLEQSQNQYSALEKKYSKAKKIIYDFQQRELDMIHREEFYQQLLQEKDTEYNALVKSLKDRVITLEQELMSTQQKTGIPVHLPYDPSSSKPLTPQMLRKQVQLPAIQTSKASSILQQLDASDFSDTEISDISPDDGEAKTATVERKLPKEDLDDAIPQHELLDVSANKLKAELATRGGLANRQAPSSKKGSLSNSSSEFALDDVSDYPPNDEMAKQNYVTAQTQLYGSCTFVENSGSNITTPSSATPSSASNITQIQRPTSLVNNHTNGQSEMNANEAKRNYKHTHYYQQVVNPQTGATAIYAHVNKEHLTEQRSDATAASVTTINASAIYSTANVLNKSSKNAVTATGGATTPSSLAEQLKQVLAEREKRLGSQSDLSTSENNLLEAEYAELNKNPAAIITHNLVEEIRIAVNEANAKVKKVVPQTLSPPDSVPWQHQSPAPPSPSSLSSGSVSPAGMSPIRHDVSWTPSHPSDVSISSTGSDKKSHFWHSGPITDWSKEQVCQWLMALNLEQHINKFLEHHVNGMALLQLESRDFKILGITGDDKSRLKRKLKELKVQVDKEKRQVEKERKEKERMMRKAEKMAEKANRKK